MTQNERDNVLINMVYNSFWQIRSVEEKRKKKYERFVISKDSINEEDLKSEDKNIFKSHNWKLKEN